MHLTAGQRVIDILGFAAGDHESVATQTGKMLREGGLTEADDLLELGNAPLAIQQLAQDEQPMRIAHRLEKLGSRTSLCFQLLNIHVC